MNKCSRYIGQVEPPRKTPPRFWDQEIIPNDAEDPRVKPKKEQPFRRKGERREEEKKRLGAGYANNLTKAYEIVTLHYEWDMDSVPIQLQCKVLM